jgi:hypothetical protein
MSGDEVAVPLHFYQRPLWKRNEMTYCFHFYFPLPKRLGALIVIHGVKN